MTHSPQSDISSPRTRFSAARLEICPHRPRVRVAVRAASAMVVMAIAANTLASTMAVAATKSSKTSTTTRSPLSPLETLEATVKARPSDGTSWNELASLYARRAYETADPSFYPRAERALARAAVILKNSPEVRTSRASLLLALHDFAGAKIEADAVLAVRSNSFDARLALADATIELGDYVTAAELVEALIEQRPGVASFSRLSYLRQLNGDLLGSEAAMRSAVSSAPANSIDRGVAQAYLGEILLERGRGDAASRAFMEALRLHPTSSVAAIGMARLHAGRGDVALARATLDKLVERVPAPGALGLLAELARATKDQKSELAANQLVDASIDLFRASGAIVDAELAVLLAERGPGASSSALAAAKKAYGARRTIFTEDAMAWALMQAGRPNDAVKHITSALATNPAFASVHWHGAVIFNSIGDPAKARQELALALRNPWFSPGERAAVDALAKKLGVKRLEKS